MSWRVRYTRAAREDLRHLYAFLLEQDLAAAGHAVAAIEKAVELLQSFPFACRKVDSTNALLRELLVPFGASGYVVLYEIENAEWVTALAARHQREDDYR